MSRRRVLIIALIALALLGGGAYIRINRTSLASAAPVQPIPFNHRVHAQAGVQCLFCHSSALRSDVAGLPSMQKCMGCHQTIAADREPVKTLTDYWQRQEPIHWQPVNTMPDFVFFSHQPHLGAGLGCEGCHGNVGQMDIARQPVNMDMGWCLDCHLKQPSEKAARLVDCLLCHK